MNYRHDLTSRLLKNYVSIRFFNSYPSSTMPSECLIRLINRVYIEHQQINRDGNLYSCLLSCIEYLNPFNDNFESRICTYMKKETVKKNRIMEYPNRQRYFHRNRCCFHIVCRFQKKKKKKTFKSSPVIDGERCTRWCTRTNQVVSGTIVFYFLSSPSCHAYCITDGRNEERYIYIYIVGN